MKEKLLLFCPFGNFRNPQQIDVFIKEFLSEYPRYRTVDEVRQIYYRTQEVKVILITENILLSSRNESIFFFTNTSGRVYKTYNFRLNESKL